MSLPQRARELTSATFLIIVGSAVFRQIFAFTGVTSGPVGTITGRVLSPLATMFVMQLIIVFLRCFLEQVSIMLITVPMLMAIVRTLGLDPVWFGLIMRLNLLMSGMSPSFGMYLFTLKGILYPPVTT